MATKILCDGCNAEITDAHSDARKGLRVKTMCQAGEGRPVLGQFEIGPFDLCGKCIDRFKHECNPKRWPRMPLVPPRS